MTTPQIERPQPDECPVCRSKDIRVHEGDTFRWRYAICDACSFRGDEVRIQTMGQGMPEKWQAAARLDAIADMHRIYDACTAPLRAENEKLQSAYVGACERIAALLVEKQDQAKRVAELEAALNYNSAAYRGRLPEWVPARVRLHADVFGDPPFRGKGVAAGDHDCQCNQHGAVSVVDRGGNSLGLRPAEFEVLSWRAALPPTQGGAG